MSVDVKKTQKYYNSIADNNLCDCNYCKNYYSQIKSAYPLVADYLASMGVDIEKPFEISPLEIDENGILEYCACQYIVFGNCQISYSHKIGNIEFRVATSYPNTGIKEEHFVIEFYPIRLKWIIFE
ncbi:TPA: hypothetical protein KOX55_000395 [Clostridioides difficile]|nr:hypothetical protein [Clostridioides difficile]